MLKEIIIAFQSYVKAHPFISKHKIWKWILIPGILYTILFCIGFYFFWTSAANVVGDLSKLVHIDKFLQHRQSATLSFFFVPADRIEQTERGTGDDQTRSAGADQQRRPQP